MVRCVTCHGGMVFLMGNLLWIVLAKVAKAIAVITWCIGAVPTNVTCLATHKTSVIVLCHIDCRGCKVAVTCCGTLSFSTNLMTSNKVLGSFS